MMACGRGFDSPQLHQDTSLNVLGNRKALSFQRLRAFSFPAECRKRQCLRSTAEPASPSAVDRPHRTPWLPARSGAGPACRRHRVGAGRQLRQVRAVEAVAGACRVDSVDRVRRDGHAALPVGHQRPLPTQFQHHRPGTHPVAPGDDVLVSRQPGDELQSSRLGR